MENEDSNPSSSDQVDGANLEQHLALLQENNVLFQNLHQTQLSSDYLQNLQLLASQMSNFNSNLASTPANPTPTLNPVLTSQQSLPNEDIEMAPPVNSRDQSSNNSSNARNRRTFSGSGSTISQHTRDRIRTMISSKNKQKQRLYSTSSVGSSVNVGGAGGRSQFNGLNSGSNSAAGSDVNLLSHLTAQANAVSQHPSVSNILGPAPQFEPYNIPSTQTTASASTSMSDFQLRKVNSEPNLKMRLRARLLNKGSSPVTNPPHPYNNLPNQTGHHRPLQRCDSDSVTTPLESLLKAPFNDSKPTLSHAQSISTLPVNSNLVIPSPSLPNLSNNFEQLQLDLNLMLQAASFGSFLSMPSLAKNAVFSASSSMLDSLLDKNQPSGSRFENVRNGNQLHVGGYPSLLKQQLRDLVLRRKSLVREEPEEEHLMEAFSQRFNALNQKKGVQLKTGERVTVVKTLCLGLVYDAAMSKHACLCGENQNHVEHGGRVHSIWARLQERGLVDICDRVMVKKASLDLLRLVHSTTYVTFFAVSPTACLKLDASEMPLKRFVQLPCGGIGVDSDTYFNDANTQLAIRVSVGSLVEMATQVAEGKLRNGFACIRPPGHHAESEQAMGFCFFNNVAITARYLQKTYSNICRRIAIIDWDVHHGNGTQLCFESDPNVLYVSLHRHDNGNFFPGTGAVVDVGKEAGKGFTINVPFSGGIMGDADYLAAWRVVVLPLLDSFHPDFVLVSAGFDGSKGHAPALGGYELTPKIYGYFTRSLMSYAEGKVVLALEGGYDLPSICDSAEECVKALCADGGDISQLSTEALEKVPSQAAQDTIQKVIAVHKKNWPNLSGIQGINMSELHWQTVSQGLQSLTVRA